MAVALLGVAAWPVFSCAMYEWSHLGDPQLFGAPPVASVGCYGLEDSLAPLFLGCLLLVLAALFPRSLWLGALGGGLVGVVVGVLVLAPFVWGLGFWRLPLLLGAVGVAAGSWLASYHTGWSHVEGDRLRERGEVQRAADDVSGRRSAYPAGTGDHVSRG